MTPKIYLIRHGEKPPKHATGLSTQGLERAQALRHVFGRSSPYNIRYIIAERPKKDGKRDRPYETILPLAQELGIEPNIEIERDDAGRVAEVAKHYFEERKVSGPREGEEGGKGNVLICWEHGVLGKIVEALGVPGEGVYPEGRFDVIWKVEEPWTRLVWVGSEGVEGLDVGVGGDGDEDGGVGVGPVIGGSGEGGDEN